MFKVGLICASDEELAPFLPHIENRIVTEKAMLTFYEGSIGSLPFVILYSGVCKVNAAIAAQILIDIYCVDTIINAGVAGGMDAEIPSKTPQYCGHFSFIYTFRVHESKPVQYQAFGTYSIMVF